MGFRRQHSFKGRLHDFNRSFYKFDKSPGSQRHAAQFVVYSCGTKKRYKTEEEAAASALQCGMKRGTILYCYKCRYCGGYHLTKKPRGKRDRVF